MKGYFTRFFWLAGLTGLLGCSSVPQLAGGSIEKQVQTRAQQRWDALMEGDLEGAYKFLSPGSRQALSLSAYRSTSRGGIWRKAVVSDVKCSSLDLCRVVVEVEYIFKGTEIRTPLSEEWILASGEWWIVRR